MKKKYYKTVNYRLLFTSLIRERYVSLILGMIVAFFISSLVYSTLSKRVHLNMRLSNPKIHFAMPNIHLAMPRISMSSLFRNNTKKTITVKKSIKYKTYTVIEGDDLWQVAEKFYGSGFNAYDISVFNKLDSGSTIVPGQILNIPEVTPRAPTVGDIDSGAATSQVTYTEGKYVVQPGDSLSIIAEKVYGDLYAWPRLLQANNLTSADRIEVGMVLTIPR